jgi:hypothetical protein
MMKYMEPEDSLPWSEEIIDGRKIYPQEKSGWSTRLITAHHLVQVEVGNAWKWTSISHLSSWRGVEISTRMV